MSAWIYEVEFSPQVSFTDATGISFVKNINPQLNPDVNFNETASFGSPSLTWTVSDGITPTTIGGGMASMGAAGDIVMNANKPSLDPLKTYEVIFEITSINAASITFRIGGNTITHTPFIGTNIISGLTGIMVGAGVFEIRTKVGDFSSVDLTSWSILEQGIAEETATGVSIVASTVSPNIIIPFNLTFAVDPVAFDTVDFIYDGVLGNFIDNNDPSNPLPLPSQTIRLHDCELPINALIDTDTGFYLIDTDTGKFLVET